MTTQDRVDRLTAGVTSYARMGYWQPDYEPKDTDVLAAFRVVPQPGVDPNEFLAYIDTYPIWAQFGWGLGVWTGLLGSILLLLRSRWAVHSFALSLLGMALSFTYVFTGPAMPGEEAIGAMKYFPVVIVALGVALLLYARNMQRKGVLR